MLELYIITVGISDLPGCLGYQWGKGVTAIGHCKDMQQYKGPRYCDCKGIQ